MKAIIYSIALLTLLSCSSEMVEIPEPSLEWQQGRNDFEMVVDDISRHVAVHVPTSYDESTRVPVVFMLHGSGGSGNGFYNTSKWVEKSEEIGFIAVFPTALKYELSDGTTSTKWSSGSLIDQVVDGTQIIDDIPFIKQIVSEVKTNFLVNESRFYISGFSNGGGFVKSSVIQQMTDVFAAANTTGGVGIPEVFPILGERIMPLFNIAGSQDPKIFENIGSNQELPLAAHEIEAHDFLWTQLTTMCEILELNPEYEVFPNEPLWNEMVFTKANSDRSCPEYRFMMVKGMTHVYPHGSNNPNNLIAADILWPWFEQWTL